MTEGEDPFEIKKEEREALQNAQKKYDMLISKRDELNAEANQIRQERDIFNDEKAEVIKKLNELKKERENTNIEIEKHKKLRDTYQKNAKTLVASKKAKKDDDNKIDLDSDIQLLNSSLKELERKYETQAHSPEAEKKIVEEIRIKRQKLEVLKKEIPIQVQLSDELKTLDERITDLFELGDKEHKAFVDLVKENKERKKKQDELYKRIKHLAAEGNKKHEEFLEARERANKVHSQIVEMREKVMAIRNDHKERRAEARNMVKEQNKRVKSVLEDEEALQSAEDSALELLKKKGKLTM